MPYFLKLSVFVMQNFTNFNDRSLEAYWNCCYKFNKIKIPWEQMLNWLISDIILKCKKCGFSNQLDFSKFKQRKKSLYLCTLLQQVKEEQPVVLYCVSCRKVKYLNLKGSLVDEHTVKGVTKAGKEVCYCHSLTKTLYPLVSHWMSFVKS